MRFVMIVGIYLVLLGVLCLGVLWEEKGILLPGTWVRWLLGAAAVVGMTSVILYLLWEIPWDFRLVGPWRTRRVGSSRLDRCIARWKGRITEAVERAKEERLSVSEAYAWARWGILGREFGRWWLFCWGPVIGAGLVLLQERILFLHTLDPTNIKLEEVCWNYWTVSLILGAIIVAASWVNLAEVWQLLQVARYLEEADQNALARSVLADSARSPSQKGNEAGFPSVFRSGEGGFREAEQKGWRPEGARPKQASREAPDSFDPGIDF